MNKVLMWTLIVLGVLGIAIAGIFVYESYYYANHTTFDKPAIYLYPEEDSQIRVELNINGKLIKDIPKYNNGWNIFVTKEGLIDNQYDYLFYENTLNTLELPEKGWIIAKKDLYNWFEINLPKFGLNEKEKIQFKEYWLYELVNSEYYEIKLLNSDFLNENMDLIITPKPDTEIRLMFYFKGIDEPHNIEEPVIKTPTRNGFTVVEWGGTLIK